MIEEMIEHGLELRQRVVAGLPVPGVPMHVRYEIQRAEARRDYQQAMRRPSVWDQRGPSRDVVAEIRQEMRYA